MVALKGRLSASGGHRFTLTRPRAVGLIRLPVGSATFFLGIFQHTVESAESLLRRTNFLLQVLADENLLVVRRTEIANPAQATDRGVSATFGQTEGGGRLPTEVSGAICSTRSRLFSEHRGERWD